mmetsp:Transcript_23726/g.46444  ORF Transcript_23726/g.46444 Transcript_23726/m.46444 type:complete len:195 (-) Transcript_23726:306-890(-)
MADRMSKDEKAAPEKAKMPTKSLFVALDGPKMSDHVIEWCAKHLVDENDQVTLLHVAEIMTVSDDLPDGDIGGDIDDVYYAGMESAGQSIDKQRLNKDIRDAITCAGRKFLQECAKKASSLGMKRVDFKLLFADQYTSAKYVISDYVDEEGPNMLVCGSRGMGVIGRTLLGSVSDYLTHRAKCTVVVVKKPTKP